MANERITEHLFRELLTEKGFYSDPKCTVEEQSSLNPKIKNLLKSASKRGGKGQGFPEVIIQHSDFPDTLIVVEAKAETKFHESKNLDDYTGYAVDGALLYGSHLSREFDVICIGVSGQSKEELKLSTYYHPKTSSNAAVLLDNKTKNPVKELKSFEGYDDDIHHDPEKKKIEYNKVMKFASNLHNYMRDYAQLQEKEKPILVSAIMLAIQDPGFKNNLDIYEDSPRHDLASELITAVINTLVTSGIPESKVGNLESTFTFIKSHEALKKINTDSSNEYLINKSHLYAIIHQVDRHVSPFMAKYHDHDIIGRFYGEFISYTGGDGKGLGIVLTPKHITEFMVNIIGIDKNSTVLDSCTGTGAFLIAAMWKMFEDANKIEDKAEREAKIEEIKQKQLVGVEMQQNMYAMACANMIFRGDGKSNLYNKDFFEVSETIKAKHQPDKAIINPPYSQKAVNRQELDFIMQTLDCMKPGGKFACIVPIGVGLDVKKTKLVKRERLLDNHTLDAVLGMPGDLFLPFANTNTCIMVFTAGIPHHSNPYHKTFFASFKDDGFKTQKKERKDTGSWPEKQNEWLEIYHSKEVISGVSAYTQVGPADEWCVEEYMETDYSNLCKNDFIDVLAAYAEFKADPEDTSSGETL